MIDNFIILALFEGALFQNVTTFLYLVILICFGIGLLSKKLTIGAFGGFVAFIHIATNVSIGIFTNFLFIIIPLLSLIVGIKIYTYSKSSKGTEL